MGHFVLVVDVVRHFFHAVLFHARGLDGGSKVFAQQPIIDAVLSDRVLFEPFVVVLAEPVVHFLGRVLMVLQMEEGLLELVQ